jgi:hypothetical protein
VTGCVMRSESYDPLKGWKGGNSVFEGNVPDKVITEDYKLYVQSLPFYQRVAVDDFDIRVFNDGNGQHAIKISIPERGTWWQHLLIYDRDDRRMKVITWISGKYEP